VDGAVLHFIALKEKWSLNLSKMKKNRKKKTKKIQG
jgi:hypothetical protein